MISVVAGVGRPARLHLQKPPEGTVHLTELKAGVYHCGLRIPSPVVIGAAHRCQLVRDVSRNA